MSALPYYGRGANDTAAAYGSIVHGMPDPVMLNYALTNQSPLYPDRLDTSKATYQKAWKGLFAFRDTTLNHRPSGAGSPDADQVWYMQALNGLYNNSDKPYQLVERMVVTGVTEDDVLALEGPSQSNTLLLTGKTTTSNTGPRTIRAFQLFYMDFPSTDEKMFSGGCSLMDGVPNKFLTLWTMPYDPQIHRCVPMGLYKFYTDRDITTHDSDYGQKLNAQKMVEASIDSAIVALGLLHKNRKIGDDLLGSLITEMKTQVYRDQFARAWLNPMEHLISTDDANFPPITSQASPDIFEGASAFKPSSLLAAERHRGVRTSLVGGPRSMTHVQSAALSTMQQVVLSQIVAAEDFCFYANSSNRYFTRRIGGRSLTIVDPGKTMDILLLDGEGAI